MTQAQKKRDQEWLKGQPPIYQKTFDSGDAAAIKEGGDEYRKTATVHAIRVPSGTRVYTSEGMLTLRKPGVVATDGERVWPTDRDYFEANYEKVGSLKEGAAKKPATKSQKN